MNLKVIVCDCGVVYWNSLDAPFCFSSDIVSALLHWELKPLLLTGDFHGVPQSHAKKAPSRFLVRQTHTSVVFAAVEGIKLNFSGSQTLSCMSRY